MSRKPVKNDLRELDELALFREPEAAAESVEAPEEEGPDAESGFGELDDAMHALDDAPVEAARPEPRVRHSHATAAPSGSVHGVWIGFGVTLFVFGILLAVAAATHPANLAPLLDAFERMGLTPVLLWGFGLAAWGVGVVLGRQGRNGRILADIAAGLSEVLDVADQVDATTRALHEADTTRAATAMSGDEIGQVLFALQRHEEKLNNLTRATKTFGKPLVEMTTLVADLAAQVASSQANVQAVRVATESGMNRLEEMLRKQADGDHAAGQQILLHAIEQTANTLQGKLDGAVRELGKAAPDAVQKHLATLSDDLGRRLTASGDKVCAALSKEIETRLAELGKVSRGSAVDLGPVQEALAALRREIAHRGGASAPVERPSPTPADTPAPAPTKTSPAASKASNDEPPASGLAQSIAGERNTKGANVLGAIAKLKKLRS